MSGDPGITKRHGPHRRLIARPGFAQNRHPEYVLYSKSRMIQTQTGIRLLEELLLHRQDVMAAQGEALRYSREITRLSVRIPRAIFGAFVPTGVPTSE